MEYMGSRKRAFYNNLPRQKQLEVLMTLLQRYAYSVVIGDAISCMRISPLLREMRNLFAFSPGEYFHLQNAAFSVASAIKEERRKRGLK